MNALQSASLRAAQQTVDVDQEPFTLSADGSGTVYYGTFSDPPQLMPVMTRTGYQNQMATSLVARRELFSITPPQRGPLYRVNTATLLFCRACDAKSPVFFQFIVVDRDV